jgi:hypothetical protein
MCACAGNAIMLAFVSVDAVDRNEIVMAFE